jgi:hypothetical protein
MPMPIFSDRAKQPAYAVALLMTIAALSACKRQPDVPPVAAPTAEAPAAPAASVTPEPSDGHATVPATGPAEGGTAVGGMVANQEGGGAAKGSAPAPTGGDAATTRPAPPPSK